MSDLSEAARPEAGEARPDVGRAGRSECSWRGERAQLFSLGPSDARLGARLLELGREGALGFVDGGRDAEGVWLVRRASSRTVETLGAGERLDGDAALVVLRALARALAAFETRQVFPGPLRPEDVALAEGASFVRAEPYLALLLGDQAPMRGERSAPSPRWTPPEQAAGEPWDNAANRYVLGLVAYRLVAGAHPFAGLGMRDAATVAQAAPPPFDDAIARALRPGAQSLVLAMLAPARTDRPSSAAAIAARCDALLEGRVVPAAVASPSPRRAPSPRANAPAAPVAPPRRRAMALAPLLAGAGILVVGLVRALGVGQAPVPVATAAPVVRPRPPLSTADAASCAACHPRQVAEWKRSVMAHASRSPLFGALESAIEEQAGRDLACPNGAGILRRVGPDACRDPRTGVAVTGSGGEHWCVNCHAAGDNLASRVPAWEATAPASRARRPLRDVLGEAGLEGISCAVCHQTVGPAHGGGRGRDREYQGNPSWTSPSTGAVFAMRPEDARGTFGISNSGYALDPSRFFVGALGSGGPGDPVVHARTSPEAREHLRSSEACGACHDVRLFGSDALGARERGEHFKRLRNAYSEWRSWADGERLAGRRASSCQDCHMTLFPGVCTPGERASGAADDGCPKGTRFEARAPGERARGLVAVASSDVTPIASHTFTGVEVPLGAQGLRDDPSLDPDGVPRSLERRRAQLLRRAFRFQLGVPVLRGRRLEVPLELENVGAGHRVPAGFSQEREVWVELVVKGDRGRVLYEVGRVEGDEADLRDKVMTRVNVSEDRTDARGRPRGVFGADVIDGPDVPRWNPDPAGGPSALRGRGLVNLQNGFYRCVRCVGVIDAAGRCQAGPGQGLHRADRYEDGDYDPDTGACRSNLEGDRALFETFFPVGGLDADRGVLKAPDAILDTRSAPPRVPLHYTYDLEVPDGTAKVVVEARLRFRAFPPFLLRAFADYEAQKARAGLRPSGPQLTRAMLADNRIVELFSASAEGTAR